MADAIEGMHALRVFASLAYNDHIQSQPGLLPEIQPTPAPTLPKPVATNLASPTAPLELITMANAIEGLQALRVFASLANYDHITFFLRPTPPSHQSDPEFFPKP